jgi:hypothetical protein
MKQLLLTLTLCSSGILVSSQVNAQTVNKNKYDEQWPPAVVLQAAEQAVSNSTEFPVGNYDYYNFLFTYSKGVWKTYVEHYSYSATPSSYIGTEIFYFKNNGIQVFDVKGLSK